VNAAVRTPSRLYAIKAPLAVVVATDSISVDADDDNGAALHSTSRSRRGDGDADSRLGATSARKLRWGRKWPVVWQRRYPLPVLS
jgi:hypothetical protein